MWRKENSCFDFLLLRERKKGRREGKMDGRKEVKNAFCKLTRKKHCYSEFEKLSI